MRGPLSREIQRRSRRNRWKDRREHDAENHVEHDAEHEPEAPLRDSVMDYTFEFQQYSHNNVWIE